MKTTITHACGHEKNFTDDRRSYSARQIDRWNIERKAKPCFPCRKKTRYSFVNEMTLDDAKALIIECLDSHVPLNIGTLIDRINGSGG